MLRGLGGSLDPPDGVRRPIEWKLPVLVTIWGSFLAFLFDGPFSAKLPEPNFGGVHFERFPFLGVLGTGDGQGEGDGDGDGDGEGPLDIRPDAALLALVVFLAAIEFSSSEANLKRVAL